MVDVKKTLMKLWQDTFTVTEYQETENPDKTTGFEEVITIENQPCKLSFSSLNTINQGDMTAGIVQTAKLFCDNSIKIKAGSRITVMRGAYKFEYAQSGEPGIFFSHQEIMLVPFERWA